jgi:putative spermidine/putrescine transport system ATP-binding protein
MAHLELRGLRKTYGDVVALDGFDLALAAGEFVSLLGPSGCGKTTALRIIAGFIAPDDGAVVLEGRDITGVPPSRRNMGMVFQAYSLFPNMTAEENVGFGLRLRAVPAAEHARRVGKLFELIGLTPARSRYPHQLSGGQQQRVALARALAIEPRVLLLDEPLSALDARVRVQLREEIRRIQTALGITTLYVTHDQEEALSISDRIVVMSAGRIEQIGTAPEIYGAPATPFVAEFVGTMNRLSAEVRDGGQGEVEWSGARLRVDAARGRAPGERVLVLVRPEAIDVEPLPDGGPAVGAAVRAAGSAPEGLVGRVVSKAFLGSVTRLKIATSAAEELSADTPSARSDAFPVGAAVRVRVAAESPRVLPLPQR